MRPHVSPCLYALSVLVLAASAMAAQGDPRIDSLDRVVRREMEKRGIPGLSIAILDSGRIVFARGYGVTKVGGATRVTPDTRFLAGSISKPVSALGAMRLVARGTIALDRDVNEQLTSWKVRDTSVAEGERVTARRLMSHTAGLNVHGFPGYAAGAPVATAVEVLNGAPPANTPAVRIENRPGRAWRYSGGGYTILQLLMEDVTHQRFADLMATEVLVPAGMKQSTFAQPLPVALTDSAAVAHTSDLAPVTGNWHSYPEVAAAGLWTTASDLLRFGMAVQASVRGKPGALLPVEQARQMLAYERNDFYGLGLNLEGNGGRLTFSHGGRDEGFDADFAATAFTGQGVAIMINANDNSGAVGRIHAVVSALYHWPLERIAPTPPLAVSASPAALDAVAGRYEIQNNRMITFAARDGRLFTDLDGREDQEFVPVAPDRFVRVDGGLALSFQRDAARRVTAVEAVEGAFRRMAPRIGPLVTQLPRATDPSPTRTEALMRLLKALADGKAEGAAAQLAPGALKDFKGNAIRELADLIVTGYAGEEDVSGRGLDRHDGKAARIVYLRATSRGASRAVLVYLTADGLLTDYDVVVR